MKIRTFRPAATSNHVKPGKEGEMKKMKTKLPTAVRALPPELRGKALQLAATLRERGFTAEKALEMSATRTGMWARHRAEMADRHPQPGHLRPRSEASPRNGASARDSSLSEPPRRPLDRRR
jgi:hypothetical protein